MNSQFSPSLPVWWSAPLWLAVFFSPTAYVLLVALVSRMQLAAPPDGLVVLLSCLIPLAALLACGTVVWRLPKSLSWRLSRLVLTALAMALPWGIWVVMILRVISAAISLPQ